MKETSTVRRAISGMTLFAASFLLAALTLHSCQEEGDLFLDGDFLNSNDIGLLNGQLSELTLDFPQEDVVTGENFDITFSSTCGKIMIERAYLEELDAQTGETVKVYAGLNCDMTNLLWESVEADEFTDCSGGTVTGNLSEPGTYVYRAKLNFKAVKNSGCPDCGTFAGNRFECFTITAVEGSSGATFTDERDGKVYKIVTIGTQTWMAENLAYNGPDSEGNPINGIVAYNNDESHVATYGWLYTWNAAMAACPPGWHLPTLGEYNTLFNYLIDNGYGYEGNGDYIAKALAATSGWDDSPWPGYPGNDQGSNNSSGFSAIPGGERDATSFWSMGENAPLWTSTRYYEYMGTCIEIYYAFPEVTVDTSRQVHHALGVRCVKNAD